MPIGLLVLNFGEPARADLEQVQHYLERIFLQNAGLEGHADEAAVARARSLAARRAPGLVEDYEAIGGSPLNGQARAQAQALERQLRDRGLDVTAHEGFQFTEPSIAEAVAAARADGADTLVALPVYPMCGHSTTVAALDEVRAVMEAMDWHPRFAALSGWHHDARYVEAIANHIRRFVDASGLDLRDADTLLYFSVHGTPVRYLAQGSRYDRYVYEHCRAVADRLGADRYGVGFQNHANRGIRWTEPDNEDAIRAHAERRLVVVPISFLHEQSETLAELDIDLRAFAEGEGKEFYRVPVPHDDPALISLLADLVAGTLDEDPAAGGALSACRCCPTPGVWCTNGSRDLPPSPYAPAEVAEGAS